jgi:hypothetical protein
MLLWKLALVLADSFSGNRHIDHRVDDHAHHTYRESISIPEKLKKKQKHRNL